MSESSSYTGSDADADSKGDQSRDNRTSTGESASDDQSSENIKKQLARKESNDILRLRVLVIMILIVAAAGVSVLVFLTSENSDEDELGTQFTGASQQLVEAFDAIKTDRISAMSAVAVATIAHGVDHSRDWPFVTLSSFQQRAFTARSNSGILQLSLNPVVTDEDREEWENLSSKGTLHGSRKHWTTKDQLMLTIISLTMDLISMSE